ncbi:arylesterase [Paracoccus sp. p3-h83]|uniref:arylesterase n=1 Tax=Paracoccus sp. p3-h83 TaxID=3342805 RepID=UPI0035B869F0
MKISFTRFFRYGAARAIRNALMVAFLPLAAMAGDQTRIIALGDSLTAGYGLPPEDGLVAQLNRWLDDQGVAATVINAGVSGDTTAGGLARLDWALGEGGDAMIVALGGNDMLRGLPVAESRANLDRIMTEAKARGLPVLLAGHQAPANYGPDWQADFTAIWPELAAAHGAILVPDMLAAIRAADPASQGALMQDDGIHPSAEGVALIVQALGPKVVDLVGRVQ